MRFPDAARAIQTSAAGVCWGDATRFLRGADPVLVDEVLARLPPSFYVVGAPRCGTTTLSRALGSHPDISFSTPKETHFLLRDRSGIPVEEAHRGYLQCFHPKLTRDTRVIGDGSVTYLYRPDAIRRALELDHRARFIVSVRNPLDMLRSYHARMLFLLDEEESDFSRAWALQDERAAGRLLPARCRDPKLLQYREAAALGRHVEALFAIAGRSRCEVVVFDDLIGRSAEVYQRLLAFLGVRDDGRREFAAKRQNAGFRHRWIQQLTMNPSPWALGLIRVSNTIKLERLKKLRKRLKRLNTVPREPRDFSPQVQTMLRDHFRNDVEKLSGLLDRDLTHWLRPNH
ncbi:MAG: sulfotransferase [Steroidobacteraceae bacterium]